MTASVARPQPLDVNWRDALGDNWRILLVFFSLCLFAAGASLPLADPDLPIHLATGEWVVKHHAVPFVEPWAWTRAGEPFQAYSWAIESVYYLVSRSFGPAGLHVLQGLTYMSLGAVILVLGHVARWQPWTTILVASIHLIVTLGATPFLRPQTVLLVVTPLVWAVTLRARDADALRWELPALTLLSAIVANTHLLFPLTAAPCVLLLARLPADRKRLITIPAAVALGWVITPYALHWVEIYRLNFAPNAMFGPPSPITEYKPGFTSAITAGVSSLFVSLGFAVLPWAAAARFDSRERALHGFLWFSGLVMFALATRALVVWWLLIIPSAAVVIDALPSAALPSLRTAQRLTIVAIFICVGLLGVEDLQDPWMSAGGRTGRTLPSINARAIEPIADWLDCNVRPEAGGRLVTIFNYGGYVPWRLPYLSESIDGRTIFPDSVAKAETYFPPNKATIPLPPWRTADLAIAPLNFPIATVLDTASGWHKVAITNQLEGKASAMIGLWVTDRWWARAGRRPLPQSLIPLAHRPLGTPSAC